MVVLEENHKHDGTILLTFYLSFHYKPLNPSFDNSHSNLNHFLIMFWQK